MSRRQRLTLIAAILGSGMAALDGSIVNVALPSMTRDLGGGLAEQQWVVSGYLLTLGACILIGGSLGDVIGRRRVFLLGVTGFAACSTACALAPSMPALIVARGLQGVCGALLTPSSLAIIVDAFSDTGRGRAIGSWTAWGGIATILGPLAGGWLIEAASWRWVFAINIPAAGLTIALIRASVPATRVRGGRSLDLPGAGLGIVGLTGVVFALIEEPRHGWGTPLILLSAATGVTALLAFLLWERRTPDPMLKLSLFRRRNFTVANLTTLMMYAALSALFFFLSLFLQEVAGYTPLHSGLAALPTTIIMFALSRQFGALAGRLGPRLFMSVGPLLASAGMLLLLRLGFRVSYLTGVLPALVVFALGLSMSVAPLTAAVLADADASDAGIASGINNAVARVAGLIGISLISLIINAHLPHHRLAANPESLHAFHVAMVICAALMAAGGLIAGGGIVNPRARRAADGDEVLVP